MDALDILFPNDETIVNFIEMVEETIGTGFDAKDKMTQEVDEAAFNNYLKMLEIDPDNLFTLNMIGAEYLKKNENDKAIEFFERALAIEPREKAFWNNVSIAYYRLGEREKAIAYFKKGLEQEKWHGSIVTQGADFILKGRSLDDFLEHVFQEELGLIKLLKLSEHYQQTGEPHKANQCFLKVVKNIHGQFAIWNNIGYNYIQLKEERKAEQCFSMALKINPTHYLTLRNMIILKNSQGKYLEAKKHLLVINQNYPGEAGTLYELACVSAHLKDRNNVIDYLSECIEIAPESSMYIITNPLLDPYLKDLVIK